MPERLTVFLIVDNAPDAEDDFYALPGVVRRLPDDMLGGVPLGWKLPH